MKAAVKAIVLAGFVALAFAIYGDALDNAFVFDDETQITGNPAVQNWRRIPELFGSSTNATPGTPRLGGIYYKPLMMTAYAGLWAMDGPSPRIFHGFQVLLHALNAWLVFLFLSRAMRSKIAALAAAVFLCHPMNAEVAIYSADLQDALYFFFGMLALLWAAQPSRWTHRRSIAITFALLASLLSKESGVLFFCAISAWTVLMPKPDRVRASIAVVSSLFIYTVLRFGVAGLDSAVGVSWAKMGHAPLSERLLTAPAAIAHYLSLFVYPNRLTVTQDWIVTTPAVINFWIPLAIITLFAGAVLVACRRLQLSRSGLFFAALLTAGLTLHAQIIPLDGTVADRWFYFPMFALLGLGGLAAARAGPRTVNALTCIMVCTIAVFTVRSHARAQDWRDGMTLYAHDLALDPENPILLNNLGVELYRRGDISAALPHFEKAVAGAPYWAIAWNNLGAALEASSRLSEAENAYRESVNRGGYYLALENYPRLTARLGKTAEARDFIDRVALPALPRSARLHQLRAELTVGGHE